MTQRTPLILLTLAVAAGLVVLHAPGPVRPIAHASFGHGPSIVLVHGLGSTRAHWLPTARLLARDHTVTLVDLPGHGVSAMPEPFSLDQAVAALDQSLDELGPGPVVLVGHSLGGLVCAAEAIAHPRRVKALVLVETALRPQVEPADRAAMLDALDLDYANFVHAAYLDFGRDSVQGEALWREVAALDPDVVRRWIRLAWSTDLSDLAGGIEAPVMTVLAPRSWGDHELWPAVRTALGYEQVPRLRPARVANAGHFVMLDQPDALAALIERFTAHPVPDQLQASR
jgi:pimeloyl-ACP methyl ester carboxylesterase